MAQVRTQEIELGRVRFKVKTGSETENRRHETGVAAAPLGGMTTRWG